MAKLGVEQFVDLIKRSGLVDDERLNQALSGVDHSVKDSGIIASSLTKAGLLTEWQSEKLLQGRHKGFYLGKYKLLNHIGTGGMGAVYLAEHQVMRHRVAIKLLPNHLAAQQSYLERFHQEARAAAALTHPNIIRAFDVDQHESYHYLVMEYVDGTDLQAVVSRSGPMPFETAANYTRQAAEGLAYAHRMGLIHRDIKPANLLVDKEGTVKILDMGLARFSDESQGSLTMAYDQKMIGTVDYLAPEQALDSHKVDARADIYSLGCTFYFLLTGDAPFPQGTIPQRLMRHQSADPTDIREFRPDVPEALVSICRKMMAKSVDTRYQSGDEVAEALTFWLEDAGYETGSGVSTREFVPPPSGPSLNEDLTLAPIDEEVNGRGAGTKIPKQEDSKASKSGAKSSAGKSGVAGSKSSPGKSGAKSGVKPGSKSGVKPGSKSGVKSGSKSGVKPGGKSGVQGGTKKSASGVKSGGSKPPVDLTEQDDLMDELLAAPALPPSEQQLQSPQSAPSIGSSGEETIVSRLGKVVGMGVGGAIVLVLILLVLIYLSTFL
ncbi:MAG: serine/threonine protein kinase [Planctomycetota bacterium]|nr:MAG: serine/threonine protein kinase [Planctomycetota bacterium]